MTKENKLPEVGKKYQEISTGRIGTLLSLGYWSGRYCAELEEIKGQRHIVREYEAFRFGFEEIPEQEPTAENHVPDARKKVDKVQEAKEGLRLKKDYIRDHITGYFVPEEAIDFNSHKRDLMILLALSENLINALDAQEIAGSKLSKTVTLAGKSDENGAEVAKSKSIWKPMSKLPKYPLDYAQDIIIKHISHYAVIASDCIDRDFDENFHPDAKYCYLRDFVDQVQDNTDRLDKLETKLNK